MDAHCRRFASNHRGLDDLRSWASERTVAAELRELERREAAYRDGREPPQLEGKTVILVDDGLATGSTMRAAALAVRQAKPAAISCGCRRRSGRRSLCLPPAPAHRRRRFIRFEPVAGLERWPQVPYRSSPVCAGLRD